MILDEKTLGELCVRVANGDNQARRDFDRYVVPIVEAIAGRWLSQQRANDVDLRPEVTAAVCAQMVAEAAGKRRTRRRPTARRPKMTPGETLSALVERHTVSRLIPRPA